jgi:hypothetical protein
MRRTSLTQDGQQMTIETGDVGSTVMDQGGAVIGTYGTDRHDELIERHAQEGWQVQEDGHVRPETVAATPQPAPEVKGEPDLGTAG